MALAYDKYIEALQVIEWVGQGWTLTHACDDCSISVLTFKRYVERDEELQRMLADAVQRGNDALADALLSPDNHILYGRTDAKMAKVMSDNIKWVLSKRDKRFADRVEHSVTLTADTAITSALEMARTRLIQSKEPVLIDVTPKPALTESEEAELADLMK